MTAVANDISYDEVFSYQLSKYGMANDIIFLFSVSGSSKNIIKCANVAKSKKIKIISFTGFNGGKIKKLSNHNLNFSSNNYGLVEDCHLTIMHYISQFIRMSYLKKNMNLSNINF
jgi:phosphoheptose isomerase